MTDYKPHDTVDKFLLGSMFSVVVSRAYIQLTGELETAVFLYECVSDQPLDDQFRWKTYQDWKDKFGLSMATIDRLHDRLSHYISIDRQFTDEGRLSFKYRVNMDHLAESILAGRLVYHE